MKKTPMRLKDREVLVNKIARGVEAENLKVLTKEQLINYYENQKYYKERLK